jgi:hypothetical protein
MTAPFDPADTATALAEPVGDLGGRFMLHPDTMALGASLGFDGFAFYAAGRGGVLGDVDADVVVAGFGFFEPNIVRTLWESGTAVLPAREAAHRYADACAAWGRAHLASADGLDRFVELAERLVAAVDPTGLPVFAGWRAEPRADDAPGRAAQLLHVLREWRGSCHVVAVLAAGLSPLEAILTKDGADQARMFGWPEPYAIEDAKAELRAEAEALTTNLQVPALEAALTADERGELVAVVGRLRAAAT